jgi:SAM-dependent methyltransferase
MTVDALKLEQEVASIRDRYARRGDDLSEKSVFHAHRLATSLEKQSAMVRMLERNLNVTISQARILEIGCGHGDNLLQFLLWGADAANLVGNELLEERLTYSRRRLPTETALVAGDARTLALEPGSFDIVMASTVFSSILDLEFRAELARHLWTLVKPGGGIFWYDFAFNNPGNPDVLKVTRPEVIGLFPEARADIERLTLAPPIARRLAPIGAPLYRMASALPFLRTHLLGWLEKRGS